MALLHDRHDLQTDSFYSCVNVVEFVNASNDYWWLLAQLGVGSGEMIVTVQTGNVLQSRRFRVQTRIAEWRVVFRIVSGAQECLWWDSRELICSATESRVGWANFAAMDTATMIKVRKCPNINYRSAIASGITQRYSVWHLASPSLEVVPHKMCLSDLCRPMLIPVSSVKVCERSLHGERAHEKSVIPWQKEAHFYDHVCRGLWTQKGKKNTLPNSHTWLLSSYDNNVFWRMHDKKQEALSRCQFCFTVF